MSKPRIISGTAKGLILQDVPGDITRPITDRVKESLFNIIGADIEGTAFLDLFGGTGSVGIEALSRGAKLTRFIDLNRTAVNVIK
ncbi:MAG TPA: RsmD family RNA methyltransferase, partial [Longilinea sp.]|nr:RsmD family RNA methyltransferase [Longilinea sp.]